MNRVFLTTCILALAPMLAYSQYPGPPGQAPPVVSPQPPVSTVEVPPDAVVISVHGLCPPEKGGAQKDPDSCTTVITRRQFEAMLALMNVTNQNYSPAALRSIAESYVQLMTLADAGQEAGIDKGPRFGEMMKIVRVRTMAEMYRRSLDEKFNAPPPEMIEAYYKENIAKYEQLKLDRVFIPLADPKKPLERVAFEKRASKLAADMRERASRGEDMNSLEAEAYKLLGLATPPATDLGGKRKGNFPPAVEKDIFALKPGEVTKVEIDLSGYSFYKLRSREPIPLEFVKPEITREMYQKNMEVAVKAATGRVHSEFNEQFFKPHPTVPLPPAFRPAPHVTVQPGAPANSPAGSGNPGASPTPGGSAAPTDAVKPPAQGSTPPK